MAAWAARDAGRWVRRSRLGFLARRLARLVVSMLALITLSFLMIHLIPGDPIRTALGPKAPLDLVRAREHAMGLDQPMPVQFVRYLKGLLTGDLGTSFVYNVPVSEVIAQRLPNSAALAGISFAVIMLVAVPLGMLAAIRNRRSTDLVFTSTTGLLSTIPEFLLGVGLVVLLGVELGWLPVGGQDGLRSYILPVAALSIGSIAALSRIVRAETLKVLSEDYITVARSKRLPARILYLRHVLPNMLTATLTLGGMLLAGLIGGTVLVEQVFAWQGLGTIVVDSTIQRDYPVAQAVFLLLGAAVLLVNLVVDVLLGILDPRSTIRSA
jgi:peptide/nickel transport system permease protein